LSTVQKQRWPWLLGATVLIALAALLMRVGEDDPRSKSAWEKVEIPRRATREDKERMEKRQVLEPLAAPKPADPDQPRPPPRPRDPVLAALGGDFKKGAFVLEANAVRNSPLGQLLVDCITSRDDGESLRRIRENSGIDPLTQLDRVAITDDMLVLTGDFSGLKTENFKSRSSQDFGDASKLYEMTRRDGGAGGTVGVWNGQLIAAGDDAEAVKQTIERIEGKRPMGEGGLTDSQAYGEIYGVLAPDELATMIGGENPELAERLKQVAQRVELHVDTSGDIGVSARVEATNAADAKEMTKALGAALSLARLKAQADGKSDEAELLDMGHVVSDGASFRLEAGVPQPWLEKALKRCVERNKARRLKKEAENDEDEAEASPTPSEGAKVE
jgi:hypothetical protein